MNNNNYAKIKNFGSNRMTPMDNPLSYCLQDGLNQKFLHGSSSVGLTPQSTECKLFMAQYCAKNWDNFCEYASSNPDSAFSFGSVPSLVGGNQSNSLGNTLILNTAKEKYMVSVKNCCKVSRPFDPTVAMSPNITYLENSSGQECIPTYEVDPQLIDSDIVMNKILANPNPYISILKNIYSSMKASGKLNSLASTKLGIFFENSKLFKELL
jgi:hypothetical protein